MSSLRVEVFRTPANRWAWRMGATVPNEVRRCFEDEIARGRILLVIQTQPEGVPALDRLTAIHHGRRLDLPATKAA